ncbi:MAG: AarF/UbiB family protein [Coriobacteriia bacterium]|nr:AarF/UbiB family protein [Coriobacteriia bacterium]
MSARSRRITGVLARHWLLGALRSGLGLSPRRRAIFAHEWRVAFEELGPAFIKLGQLISVRPDEFGRELVAEMAAMQDSVPAIPASAIRAVIEGEFGRTPEQLFATFDDTPIASASIAQVHGATLAHDVRPVWGEVLPAGAQVVVKVVRPGAEAAMLADTAEAHLLVARWGGLLKGFDATKLIDEFEESVRRELDLRVEAKTADRFAFDFREDEKIEVPRIVWNRTTRRVVTMERVIGWRLTDLDEAARAGIDSAALAMYGATAFMRQVMVYGRYHADLHPANLFVTPRNTIAYLDFGIVGHLTKDEREDIAQVLAGLAYRDPDRALRYSRRLGVNVPPDKVDAVRRELGVLLDSMFDPEGSKEFRHFGLGFIALLRRYGIEIPSGYGLLVKSLATVEGCARSLNPDIDIIDTARPFVTRLLSDSMGKPERLQGKVNAAIRAALRELVA